jgi:hypothetical protein
MTPPLIREGRPASHWSPSTIGLTLCVALVSAALGMSSAFALEKCEALAEVRAHIDSIVKTGSSQAEKFRSEVKSGADSLYVIEQFSSEDMGHKLDVCRYEAVEHLVKLGFPPAH